MINTVLYSDQIIPANSRVDERLLEMMQCRGDRIGYIPSGLDPTGRFVDERRAYYSKCGLDIALVYDLDESHSRADLDDLLACNAIHLSGGNTAGFLARLKRRGILEVLRRWVLDGGLLIGVSAGAILMTPTIAVDALFSGGEPEDVHDGTALDLLPFEFFPHLQAKASYLAKLIDYSKGAQRPIIACPDGDGVVVRDGSVECVGDPLWLSNGSIRRIVKVALEDVYSLRV